MTADLVTTEMLRAAQLRTELGAYACANLSGAYDLLRELFAVMAEVQAPEEGDDLRAAATQALETLGVYVQTYNDYWERGMDILEPQGDAALARLRAALAAPNVQPKGMPAAFDGELNEAQIERAWRLGFKAACDAERLNATEEWGYKAANVIEDVQGLVGVARGIRAHVARQAQSPTPAHKAEGRANPGDETGGAVKRFGWAVSADGEHQIVPATNGAFVWFDDYLALWRKSQAPAVAHDMRDAYVGAREDLAIWKRRALEAEAAAQYAPLTGDEIDALTCMQAGAPWGCISELQELFALYDRLRAAGRRPFDPGTLSEAESDAYWERGEFPPAAASQPPVQGSDQ